jgi:hypothetical protein
MDKDEKSSDEFSIKTNLAVLELGPGHLPYITDCIRHLDVNLRGSDDSHANC